MIPDELQQFSSTELKQILRMQIERRTFGRIRCLRVEVVDKRVIVQGYTPVSYIQWMALVAIREVLKTTPVELNIQADTSASETAEERDLPKQQVEEPWTARHAEGDVPQAGADEKAGALGAVKGHAIVIVGAHADDRRQDVGGQG